MVSTSLDEGQKIRVMLVDDSTIFLRAATFFLQQHPQVEVVGALCRGDQALDQARLLRPQIVLLDLSLPGLPGLQLIAQLRAVMPEVRVIVLTLLDIDAFRQVALAAGAAAFVSKVNARTDLLPAIWSAAHANPNEGREAMLLGPGRFQDRPSPAKRGRVYG